MPMPENMFCPRMSLILCANGNCADVLEALAELAALDAVAAECILVDNASPDDTVWRALSFRPGLRVVPRSDTHAERGLCHGLLAARAPYVAVVSASYRVTPEAIRAMLDHVRRTPRALACAIPREQDGTPEWSAVPDKPTTPWPVLDHAVLIGPRDWLARHATFCQRYGLPFNPIDAAMEAVCDGYDVTAAPEWTALRRAPRTATQRARDRMARFVHAYEAVQWHFAGPERTALLRHLRTELGGDPVLEDRQAHGCPEPTGYRPLPDGLARERFRAWMTGVPIPTSAPVSQAPVSIVPPARGTADWRHFRTPADTDEPAPCYWERRLRELGAPLLRDDARIRRRAPLDAWNRCTCARHFALYRAGDPVYAEHIARYSFVGCQGRRRREAECRAWDYRPRISILLLPRTSGADHLRECLQSLTDQIYPVWELCVADVWTDAAAGKALRDFRRAYPGRIRLAAPAADGNTAQELLRAATGDYVLPLAPTDRLATEALHEMVRLLNAEGETDWLYPDEDAIGADGLRAAPRLKPDWSPELFLSGGESLAGSLVRRALVNACDGFASGFDGNEEHELFSRMASRAPRIRHIPRILLHRRHEVETAESTGVRARIITEGLARAAGAERAACHIIGTGATACIRRQIPVCTVDLCILGAAQGSRETAEAWRTQTGVRIGHIASAREGQGAVPPLARTIAGATAPYLFICDGGTVPIGDEVLALLAQWASMPGVAAATAACLFGNTIDHSGLAFDADGMTALPLRGARPDAPVCMYGTVRNVSAVSGAATLVNIAAIRALSPWPANMQTPLGAFVWLSLSARTAGWRLVADRSARAGRMRPFEIPAAMHPGGEDFSHLVRRFPGLLLGGDPFWPATLRMETRA